MITSTIDSTVRIAGPEDEAELLRLCRAKHAEEDLRKIDGSPFTFSEERTRATLHRAIIPNRNSESLSWCGVIGDVGGPLVGSVYLSVQTPYDSEEQYLLERWNWIYPEHRKGHDYGTVLLSFSRAIAEELKMIVISGVVSATEESPKGRFFKRNGCRPLGTMYIYGSHGAN